MQHVPVPLQDVQNIEELISKTYSGGHEGVMCAVFLSDALLHAMPCTTPHCPAGCSKHEAIAFTEAAEVTSFETRFVDDKHQTEETLAWGFECPSSWLFPQSWACVCLLGRLLRGLG